MAQLNITLNQEIKREKRKLKKKLLQMISLRIKERTPL